jgi:hypothetical protein
MYNSQKIMPNFKKLIEMLMYHHGWLSVAVGEDSSGDNTAVKVEELVKEWRSEKEFRRVEFHHFSELHHQGWGEPSSGRPVPKHDLAVQLKRRRHIALARNMLLMRSLRDEDYVMWIDSDVEEVPPDIIQRLLSAKKDIVIPSCMIRSNRTGHPGGFVGVYDWNTWKETKTSLEYTKKTKPDYLFLEGYKQQRPKRLTLVELKNEGDLVEVDGIGGCLILVKAIHHRQGLNFPPYVFKNQIETEGFSRMAQAMGLKLWLMPKLHIFHTCNNESFGQPC